MRLTNIINRTKYNSPFVAQLVKLSSLPPRDIAKICIIIHTTKKIHPSGCIFNVFFIIINIMIQKKHPKRVFYIAKGGADYSRFEFSA